MPRKEDSSSKSTGRGSRDSSDMSEDEGQEKEESIGDSDARMEQQSDAEEDSGDEVMEENIASPSPGKRGMQMRSGRSKRRRSRETTGLTPPDGLQATKKAKVTTERRASKRKAIVQNGEAESTAKPPKMPVSQRTTPAFDLSVPSIKAGTAKSSRSSLLSTDATAVAKAQDPERSLEEGGVLSDGDSNRQLFAGQSPITLQLPRTPAVAEASSQEKEEPRPTSPDLQIPHEEIQESSAFTNGETVIEDKSGEWRYKPIIWRIGFMLLFTFPMAFIVWPLGVKASNYIIPLKELTLPELSQPEISFEAGPGPELSEAIESLPKLRGQVERGRKFLEEFLTSIDQEFADVSLLLREKTAMLQRSALLSQAEFSLLAALDASHDLKSHTWQEVRTMANALGHTILDTPSIPLWHADGPESCDDASSRHSENARISIPYDDTATVKPIDVDEQLAELGRMTQMSVASLMMSPEAKAALRSWVKAQIEVILEGHEEDLQFIREQIPAESFVPSVEVADLTRDEIKGLISDRLDLESADRTGSYDHASIYNGAKIIRDGKRATSKSLVDSLPLGNRLLQLSRLQFYGFGPEAAITPTYPMDALGQCWSFEEMSIEELQRLPRSEPHRDEPKNGNLGTLSISLPNAVAVRSVVVEHPPRRGTDQTDSAIRGFRVIGFEDAEAETKAWPLGSFQYDIRSSMSLQEFEVETQSFGREMPPLHSITLAIDSNWGNAYSCLYRFRVHGEDIDEEVSYQ